MANNSLRQKTVSAMIWSAVGKFGGMTIQFISNMVLARLLMPEDFGAIGMLAIFITLSETLIASGFGAALIQKKEPTHLDYSSVFYFNLCASIIICVILYFASPFIAKFYRMPVLCNVLRVESFVLIIYSFTLVQTNQLMKQLRFKDLSVRGVIAAIMGTIVAIAFALQGYGIWSLVYSYIASGLISLVLLWKMSSWRPGREFSWLSLKELFNFGGLMALSSIVESIASNLQGFIIGRMYTPADMGYYSQGRKLEQVPTQALTQIVSQVSFPVFSSLQDDKEKLLRGVRKNIKTLTYVTCPMCILLVVIAEPLIVLLYGERWLPSVPYFQLLCIGGGMMLAINNINVSIIKALGKSKLYFHTSLIKRLVAIAAMVIGAQHSVMGIVIAAAIVPYIYFIINTVINRKLLGYGALPQLLDLGQNFLLAIIVGAIVYELGNILEFYYIFRLIFQISIYVALYLLLSFVTHNKNIDTYISIIKERVSKK